MGGDGSTYGGSSSCSSPMSNGGAMLTKLTVAGAAVLISTPVRTTKASRLRAAALGKMNMNILILDKIL